MLKKIRPCCFLFFIPLLMGIFSPLQCSAEKDGKFKTGKWGIEANYVTGQFLKHGVATLPSQPAQGFEVNYLRKTLGEKLWHKGMNFPEIGASFTFFYFGDNQVFGNAIALMGYGKFFMVRSKLADLYMRIGGGYALVTRVYNSVSNPNDQLISTMPNLAIQLKLGLDWKINQYVQINTAIGFNHFSNSGMQLPNFGMNLPTGTIGIRVFPQPRELSYNCDHNKDFKKNELMWKYSIGIQQLHSFGYGFPTPSTRKYPVPGGLIAYARYINYGIKFYGGLSFEYFPSIRDYLIMNPDVHTRYSPTFEASIPSALVGSELKLGRLSMFYSVGAYLWKSTATITPVYFKLGMNLYLAEIKKRPGTTFFFGNNVKAHTNVAQYNEFSIGGTL